MGATLIVVLLMIFGQSFSFKYNTKQAFVRGMVLAKQHNCTPFDNFASRIIVCLDQFAAYSKEMNINEKNMCDYINVARQYDLMSRCIEETTESFNCEDRFVLFDKTFRSVAHPAFFFNCSSYDIGEINRSRALTSTSLAVLSTAVSTIVFVLVYLFIAHISP